MALFQEADGDPRVALDRLADVLSYYGAVGDAAAGLTFGFSLRKAAFARSIAEVLEVEASLLDAVSIAGLLHAVGAIGNPALVRENDLPERLATMERWDIPAAGARICAAIGALPERVADIVRWQAEAWDGTGFPDQLRWNGIPLPSVALALADRVVRAHEPEEALASIAEEAGRSFAPAHSRAFMLWFHRTGAEAEPFTFPRTALLADFSDPGDLLLDIADRIDRHLAVPGRARNVLRLAEASARALGCTAPEIEALRIAALTFGAGELGNGFESTLDPLVRLGLERRAEQAQAGARLLEGLPALAAAAPLVAARAEWFDGTGKPAGLARDVIPIGARILATAIAYDAIDIDTRARPAARRATAGERLDGAAGTHFDPRVVTAVLDAAKAHA
ncbi:MAG: hypothetical protein HKL91_08900 [Candidatus Eremiobacteraeota bacterium]|uniref:Putative Metal dependent phosphohydrolase n=1 Tax=mine drainage metagenome TaxID=410659 RepID=E6Q7T9_9ZZZZ|nr:hypothetical protein [Candidatus Eremiobacteraeota bacterium]